MTLEEMKKRVVQIERLENGIKALERFKLAGIERIEIVTMETASHPKNSYLLTPSCGLHALFAGVCNDFLCRVDEELERAKDEIAKLLTP